MCYKGLVIGIVILHCFSSAKSLNVLETIKNGLQNYDEIRPKDLSEECSKQLNLFTDGLQNQEPWTVQMLDAASKLQSGITEGNLYNLGSFDQCLGTEVQLNETLIRGKYCLGNLNLQNVQYPGIGKSNVPNKLLHVPIIPGINRHDFNGIIDNAFGDAINAGIPGGSNFALSWASCLPAVCNASEINEFYDQLMNRTFRFTDDACQTKETMPKLNDDSSAVAAVTIFGILAGLIVLSTIYDVFLYYTNRKSLHDVCLVFSALTNFRKVVQTTNNPNQLLCLNGLKGISMMWVLIGHGYMTVMGTPTTNLLDMFKWISDKSSMFILGSTVSVDTFFMIGGLLVAYTFFAATAKGVKFNIIMYYVHRYIRLTPPLAAIVWVNASLLPYLSSGPVYPANIQHETKTCTKYWWAALLYIQNYYNNNEVCIMQSWYLSVDMQLFLISPLLLIPLKKKPVWGLVWLCLLCLASIASTFAVAWHYKMVGLPNSNANMEHMDKFNKYIYFATHSRMPPYLIGIVLGYYIHNIKAKKIKVPLNNFIVLFLWACSLAILASCVFAGYNIPVGEYNRFEQTAYITFVRPAWAIGLCWVIFACVFGYGGPVNWILSCAAFQILSKLSYSMYIVHILLLRLMYFSTRTPFRFSNVQMMYNFWGDFWFTMGLSLIWTLMFESPMITIEKIIFGKGKTTEKIAETSNGTRKDTLA